MAEFSRVLNSTIHDYIRGEEVAVLRNRKILALMKDRGRITFNHEGDLMDWKVRYKQTEIQGYADSDTLTFARRDKRKTAQLEWRGYAATDQINKLEKLKNKGKAAIVKVFSSIVPTLMEDISEQFGDELLNVDGNAAGNEKRIHGAESCFGVSGASANGYVALPSDTYAGLTTGLGDYGGSWSTSGGNSEWPIGTGDSHYDFWSPLVVDYTDTAWAATTKTWANTCVESIRFGIDHSNRNKTMGGMLSVIMLDRELFRQLKEAFDDNERLTVKRGEGSALYRLGFTDTINFDGVDITSEYSIASGVGYGLPIGHMELCSLQGQLFVPNGPDFDIAGLADRFAIDFFGNLKFKQLRSLVKWASVT